MKPAMICEHQLDLGQGLSIWKVDVELCRERDKNARVMDKETFERLQSTIGRDGRLESLPYGYMDTNATGNKQFCIVSGHHRTRAARMAGVTEIHVIVDANELTEDQIKAKQLSHNAISGHDDPQVLKEIYESIQDIDAKLETGIKEAELEKDALQAVSIDELKLDFDFKTIRLLFLPSQLEKFDEVCKELMSDDVVRIADIKDFDKVAESIRELSKVDNIRNVSSIFGRMCEIVMDYCKDKAVVIDPEQLLMKSKTAGPKAGKIKGNPNLKK